MKEGQLELTDKKGFVEGKSYSDEIAKIQDIVQTKDPIVFGCINKCADRFFIAQWDDDVSIEQILNDNEG